MLRGRASSTSHLSQSCWVVSTFGIFHVLFYKLTMLLAVWCVFADFALAILPWVFLWPLHMSKNEKITIAGSMSLGVM